MSQFILHCVGSVGDPVGEALGIPLAWREVSQQAQRMKPKAPSMWGEILYVAVSWLEFLGVTLFLQLRFLLLPF